MSFQFGKYKTKSYDEVFDFDRRYMQWLYSQDMIMNRIPDLKSYLDEKFKNGDMSYCLTFGKYRGKTIKEVLTIDRPYLEWLLNSPQTEKMTKLRSDLKDIL